MCEVASAKRPLPSHSSLKAAVLDAFYQENYDTLQIESSTIEEIRDPDITRELLRKFVRQEM